MCATGAVHTEIFRSIRCLPNPVPSRHQNGHGLWLQSVAAMPDPTTMSCKRPGKRTDLHRDFPEMTGLSARNLKYMRTFVEALSRSWRPPQRTHCCVGLGGRISTIRGKNAMTYRVFSMGHGV